jgi:hypothetical protein
MKHILQPELKGCGIACIAMMMELEYDSICEEYGRRFTEKGTNLGAIIEFLANHGYASITKYHYSAIKQDIDIRDISIEEWPPKPFAPIHIVELKQPSGNYHFVVMEENGNILDPLREGIYKYSDWADILSVCGFYLVNPPDVFLN